jgi:hypothetical protein
VKVTKPKTKLTRVIIDTRDASRDIFIPIMDAKSMWDAGTLAFDETNKSFCRNDKTALTGTRQLLPTDVEVRPIMRRDEIAYWISL